MVLIAIYIRFIGSNPILTTNNKKQKIKLWEV
jgi:hypothetical protein